MSISVCDKRLQFVDRVVWIGSTLSVAYSVRDDDSLRIRKTIEMVGFHDEQQ